MKVQAESETNENVGHLNKAMPKDALVMASILRDMGIMEWEPRVINQLLEFSYNYVTNVLDDAKMLASHARKKNIDVEDVRLAVQMYSDQNMTSPPPRDTLLEVARNKNNSTLPVPKLSCGLRLPPDRFCLTACNFKLKSGGSKKQPPRPGPYYFGAANSQMAGRNKVMMSSSSQHSSMNPGVPTFSMAPQGLMPNQPQVRQVVKINTPMSGTPTKIQLQPQNPAVFTMTINPNNGTSLKRKAEEMN